jgi:hypothetical protein
MRLGKYLLAFLLTLSGVATAGTCGAGYDRMVPLIVPKQHILGSTTLTNFMVPQCFNGLCDSSQPLSILKDGAHGGLINNSTTDAIGNTIFADGIVCDADDGTGNAVKFQVRYWDGVTGKTKLFWQATLVPGTEKRAYLFLGKASVTTNQTDLSLLTDAGYLWAIGCDDPGTLNIKDSVGILGTASTSGTVTVGSGGPMGGYCHFAGSGNLRYVHANGIDTSSAWAYEQWVRPTSNGTQILQDQGNNNGCSTPSFLTALISSAPSLQVDWCAGGADHGVNTGTVPTNRWTYIVGGIDGTTARTWFNGVAGATGGASGPYTTTSADLYIGRTSTGTLPFSGDMAEMRKSSTVKSSDWYLNTYYSMFAAGGYAFVLDARRPAGMTSGSYCIPVRINHLLVPSTQTNYIFPYHGYYKYMADTSNGGFVAASIGAPNIRWFGDSGCTTTPLTFAKNAWINTTGESAFDVLVPSVSSSVDTAHLSEGRRPVRHVRSIESGWRLFGLCWRVSARQPDITDPNRCWKRGAYAQCLRCRGRRSGDSHPTGRRRLRS